MWGIAGIIAGLATGTSSLAEPPSRGGGPMPSWRDGVSNADRLAIQAGIERYESIFGAISTQTSAVVPPKFEFYPMAGRLYRDLYTTNFNDLDPGPGILDWDCTDHTYDGHDATDVIIRTFGEQAFGVPIFAAQDGTVINAHDGEDDMNTTWEGQPANFVVIDHNNGRRSNYWHMKKGSVAVTIGQEVRAGEQIGLIGSSGISTWPHLHFATYDSGVRFEPYAGDCRPGESGWVDQTPIRRDLYLADFNVTDVFIEDYPGLPFDMPRTGTFVLGTRPVSFWINLINMPSNSSWRVRYRRPDLSVALDSGTGNFGNPFYRWAWWWWRWNVDLNVSGTWHILLDINGATLIEAPFDVVPSTALVANHAPNPIAVSLDPPNPRISDVIFCNVDTDLSLDDADYQIVRYHYVWTVDAVVVRDVTTAAHSDAIPHHTVGVSTLVECTVTPTDGTDDGPSASASATVSSCPASSVPQPDVIEAKNRYLSFSAGEVGESQAVRVILKDLPDANASLNGTVMWVGEPELVSENSGSIGHIDGYSDFSAATLQCAPFFADWTAFGTVHVSHPGIVPKGVYDMQVVNVSCSVDTEASFSLPLTLIQTKWGDCCGPFTAGEFAPPDGSVDVTLDVVAMLNKFRNLPGAPAKSRVDLEPDTPDRLINFTDITRNLDAFRGFGYPFPPAPAPCGG